MAAIKVSPSDYQPRKLSLEKSRYKGNIAFGQLVLYACICLLCGSVSSANICDPNDKSTCRFMGKCISIKRLPHVNKNSNKSIHLCICPTMSCYELPERTRCGSLGDTKKSFFNELCLRLSECELQRPIKTICHGACGTPNCRKPRESQSCPQSEHDDYCLNQGVCLMDGHGEPYCKCRSEYEGARCERKSAFKFAKRDRK